MASRSLILGLAVAMGAFEASAAIWYVDKDNAGTQNGTSWDTAFATIQQAIDATASGDRVWVAEGVYNEQRTADATGSLVLKSNVSVYGGFIGKAPGGYETQLSQRNAATHVTTVDGANGRGASTRAYHVVKGASSSTFDGFTVTGGNADGSGWNGCGGGFFSDSTTGTVSNCIFTANNASVGGAIGTRSSTAAFAKCVIYSNTAYSGAGVYNDGGAPVFTNCLLYRNVATNGGGLSSINSSTPALANCTFSLNQATSGAGIYADAVTVTAVNCILYFDSGGEIVTMNGATVNATYSNIQGGYAGTNNLNQNPVFADVNTNDFRIGSGSPSINTGTANGTPTTDIVGIARPQGAALDMGAYEMAAPVAEFSAAPSYGPAALAVQFTDATSTPSCVPITAWSWVFGDSANSLLQSPLHVYGTPGVFAVTLTVTTAVGSSSKTNYISTLASLQSIQVMSGLEVDVLYNGAMGTSATTAANYTLSGAGKGTLADHPASVTLVGPNRYRLAWTTGEMVPGGNIVITVANVLDAYDNVLSGFNTATAPGGGIGGSPGVDQVTVASALTVDVAYNRPMGTGVTTAANYTLAGSGKGTLADHPASVALIGSNRYRLTWSAGEMIDRGDITIAVANVSDAYGSAIGAYNTGTHAGGAVGVAPRVTAVAAQTAQTIDVTFSEAMGTGVTVAANYTLSGPGIGSLSPNPTSVALNTGNKYRLTWSSGEMVNGATITVTVTGVSDAPGNQMAGINNAGTHASGGIGALPTVTGLAIQSGSSMDVTFAELLGEGALVPTNYIVTGSGLGTLNAYPAGVVYVGSNKYRLIWTTGEMVNGGNITVTVSAVEDTAGNPIGASNNTGSSAGGAIGVRPTVLGVSVPAANAVNVLFSESMGAAALTKGNYVVSGTGKGSLASTPDTVTLVALNTYRLAWNTGEMFDGGNITVTASGVSDLAGNTVGTPNAGTATGGAIAALPEVTMASTTASTTGASPIPVTVTFAESVTGFASSDILATNATVTSFAGSGASYSFNLVPVAEGLVTANIAAGVAADAAGNANPAVENVFTRVFSRTSVTSANVVFAGLVDVAFSAAMSDDAKVAANYTLSGSGKGSLAAHPDSAALLYGNIYRLTWNAGEMFDRGNITITAVGVHDAAGNLLGASNVATHYSGAVGNAPTVYMTTTAQGTTNVSPIPVTATFSESVTGFTTDGISPMNATVQNLSGSGTTYTFNLVPAGTGPVFAQIQAGAAIDAAGNRVTASPMFVRLYDPTSATVDVVSANVVFTGMVDVTFNTPMDDDAAVAANYTISGSGKGSLAAHPNTAALLYGNTYRLTWNTGEMLDRGNITIVVAGVHDANGSALSSANTATHYSGAIGVPPTVYMTATAQGTTNVSPIPVNVVFSEAVTGLTADGISPMNATVQNLSGSGSSYTFNLVPAGAGPVFAQIQAGAASDAAGNRVSASPMFVRLFDANPPAVMVTLDEPSPTDAESIAFRVTFSEDVDASFNAGNVTLLGSLASIATFDVSGTSPSFKVQVTLSDADASGNIGIHVSPAGVKDVAGNACVNEASAYGVIDNSFGFTAHPEGGQIYAGEPYTFTVELTSHADPVVLQWKWENNQGVVANVGFDSPTLTLPDTTTAQSGRFWCEASYHDVTYSSRKATLTVVGLLTIVSQPQSVAVSTGQPVSFTVTASGGAQPLRYTWRKNGVDIPNAIGATYTVASAQLDDAAGYTCHIRDDRTESVTSEMAVLRITAQSLPVAGAFALAVLAAILLGVAVLMIRTRAKA